MADTRELTLRIGHPAPLRHEVRKTTLVFALFAAPIVWIGEQLVGFGFTSYICYTGQPHVPLAAVPGWLQPVVSAVNIIALLIGIAGLVVSIGLLRRTGREHEERSGEAAEGGEGRTRVLAIWGAAAAAVFVVAMAMNTLSLFLVPLCRA